ncbi:hypothetical protein [Mycobacterium sp.]|uniref:hypothetical protein n=1 Tax=Mycobacterium sp. TaxID=1785 RepID=UPI003F9A9E40
MDASDPQSLASSLASMLNYAVTQAQQDPNSVLQDLFNGLPALSGQSSQLPDDVVDSLRGKCDPLDWWSLLVFVMLRIEQPLRPSVWVGAAQPDGWAKMLTLNYSPDAQWGAPPTPPVLTVGLAVTDSGPGLSQGVWVNVAKPFTHDISYPPSLRLAATLSGKGTGTWTWEYPFNHPPAAVAPAGVSAAVSVSWAPGWSGQQTPVYDLSLGGLSASLQLGSSDPNYRLQAGLGPFGGTLTPQGVLGDGLASLAKLGDISVHYNPSLVIQQGVPPSFSLGS